MGRNNVGKQMTADGQTMAAGFTSVSSEATTTLLDLTVNLLEELSLLYAEDQAQEMFVQLLQGLTSVMSDRAVVMKSFGQALNAEKKELLQTSEELHLLTSCWASAQLVRRCLLGWNRTARNALDTAGWHDSNPSNIAVSALLHSTSFE